MKELTIEITNKCPLKCVHCSTEASTDNNIFMPPLFVENCLKDFPDFEVVRFSGGEPFEHPEFLEILKLSKSKNRKNIIMTCGTKNKYSVEKDLLKECNPYLDELIFSVHGKKDLHNHIAGDIEYSYDNLWNSVQNARKLKIGFSFHTVVLKENYNFLDEIIKEIYELGKTDYQKTNIRLLRLVYQGRAKNLERLTKEEEKKIPELARKLSNEEINITYTNSFDLSKCECKDRKAAITYTGREIGCSALKEYSGIEKLFACRKF